MKSRKRTLILGLTVLLLAITATITAAMMIPSADELLTQSLETLETITDGRAVIEVTAELPDETHTGTFAVWGKLDVGPNGEPAGRVEVLAASVPELVGVTAVTDGTQFWLYDPNKNIVVVGKAEEMAAVMAEKMAEHEGEFDVPHDFDPETADIPETPAEAVAKLLEYVTAERDGTEEVAGTNAYRLRLVPIPEQMPDEARATGGFINLWLRTSDQLPLAVEYAEGAVGYGKIEATEAEINTGLDASIFTFDIPAGAEVVQAVDLLEQMEAMKEAANAEADFEALTPAELPDSAQMAGIQSIGGAIVQRYSLGDGRTFVVAQGQTMPLDAPAEATQSETVTVRGVEGTLFSNDDGSRTLLAWEEDGFVFVIGGDVTPEQALAVAESLR